VEKNDRDRPSLEHAFQAFVNQQRGIREPLQRVAKLLEFFNTLSPSEITACLNEILTQNSPSKRTLSRLQLDLITHRSKLAELGYETLSSVYQAAIGLDAMEVKLLLHSDPQQAAQPEEMPGGYRAKLASLTLGERKQLSRGKKRPHLELLLFDDQPAVIRSLLQNPKIVERDVVRIASRHLARTAILNEIIRSSRWMSQYRVRKALVFNPQTLLFTALSLLPHLRSNDLRLLIGSSLPIELIEQARKQLKRKK